MKVFLTPEAENDLREVGGWIARDNPLRASAFIDELFDRCATLASMPYGFPLVPGYEEKGIRRRVHRGYLIFYRVRADTIEIIRILHGARDYESILFSDD